MSLIKCMSLVLLSISLNSFKSHLFEPNNKSELFSMFLKEFKKTDLPATLMLDSEYRTLLVHSPLPKKQIKKHSGQVLGLEYIKFIPEIKDRMMSRMGPSTYKAKWLMVLENKVNLVIYSIKHAYRPTEYCMATFDYKGNLMHKVYLDIYPEKEYSLLQVAKDFSVYELDKNTEKPKRKLYNIGNRGQIDKIHKGV